MIDDARLAVLYDVDNPDGPDHDFFRAHANDVGARRIVDLGCGTGVLTVTLARADRVVVGVDPSRAMLDRARQREGGEGVTWLLGASELLERGSADLVVMSGNVAMHLIGVEWHEALADIARCLVPGGRLVFETRNPSASAWESWSDPGSERETPVGRIRESMATEPPDEHGVVVLRCRNTFLASGESVDVDQPLQFRTREQVEADLEAAGLRVLHVWGDWSRTPVIDTSPLMVFDVVKP